MARVWQAYDVVMPNPQDEYAMNQSDGRWVEVPDPVPVTAAPGSYVRNPWFNQNNPRVTPLRSEPVVVGQPTGSRVNKTSSNRNIRRKVVLPPDSVDYSHSTTPPLPKPSRSIGAFVRDENGNPIPIYDGSGNTGQFLTSHNAAKESIRSGYTDSNGYLLDENGNILYNSNKNPIKGTFSSNNNNISGQPVVQLSQEPNISTPVITQTVVEPAEKNIYDTYEKPRTKSLSSWWQKDLAATNPLMWGLINRIITLPNVFKDTLNTETKYTDPLSRWR